MHGALQAQQIRFGYSLIDSQTIDTAALILSYNYTAS